MSFYLSSRWCFPSFKPWLINSFRSSQLSTGLTNTIFSPGFDHTLPPSVVSSAPNWTKVPWWYWLYWSLGRSTGFPLGCSNAQKILRYKTNKTTKRYDWDMMCNLDTPQIYVNIRVLILNHHELLKSFPKHACRHRFVHHTRSKPPRVIGVSALHLLYPGLLGYFLR
jgi:hypothetical protein